MKLIKKLIFMFIVILIIILILLFTLTDKGNDENLEENNNNEVEINEMFNEANQIQKISNMNEYSIVQICINKYMSLVTDVSTQLEINPQNDDNQLSEAEQKLLNIIPDFVINELNLNNENIYEKVQIPNRGIKINTIYVSKQTISKQAYKDTTNINAYIVNANLVDMQTKESQELNIIILADSINSTFYIIPEEYIEKVGINLSLGSNLSIYDKEEIEENETNTFSNNMITAEQMCQKHFADYKFNVLYNIEMAYDSLDEQYREKRFGSIEKYQEYIEESKFKELNISQYLVNNYEDYTQYVCKDQYGNLYIFEETYPMEYTLKLDTYTIMTDKFKQEYDNGSDQTKVQMNIDKFILMINNQDYESAYNVLDENFKNNYFSTLDAFKQYVQENMYRYNDLSFESFDVNGNIYSTSAKLTDLTEGKYVDDSKGTGGSGYIYTWNFVMQLKDDYGFVLSFEVM